MQYQEIKERMHASFLFLLGIFFFFTFNFKKMLSVFYGDMKVLVASTAEKKYVTQISDLSFFVLPQASLPWYLVWNTKKRLTFLYLQRPLIFTLTIQFVNYCQSARSVEGIANSSISEPCSRWSCSQCMKLKLIDRKIIHTKSTSKVC